MLNKGRQTGYADEYAGYSRQRYPVELGLFYDKSREEADSERNVAFEWFNRAGFTNQVLFYNDLLRRGDPVLTHR